MQGLEQRALQIGLRMTRQRRAILRVITAATDQPTAQDIYRRAVRLDPTLSLGAVYRHLLVFSRAGVISRIEFGRRKTHYVSMANRNRQHLLDSNTGRVIAFHCEEVAVLLNARAAQLGYRLLNYRVELLGKALGNQAQSNTAVAGDG